jgi:hypothetical protein
MNKPDEKILRYKRNIMKKPLMVACTSSNIDKELEKSLKETGFDFNL